jgi:cobalamin biosynthetic protein CobC
MKTAGANIVDHGGSLAKAEALFPGAPKPWIDLSTGINPHAYPLLDLPATASTRLPEPADVARLQAVAAGYYGAPSPTHVVAAAGTQIMLPMIAALRPVGETVILGPTYEEHARAARLAGHKVRVGAQVDELVIADIAVVVNPNNPDGRVLARSELLAIAERLADRGGLLVVDEAFMDVCPTGETLAGDVEAGNIVVLRSFGKFFGLAGLRLGFTIASDRIARTLREKLGPWAVSGPALPHGLAALSDTGWQETARTRLASEAARLHRMLETTGGAVSGGANLYRHLRLEEAQALFADLGGQGIYVRVFADRPDELRFGLPTDEVAWLRLERALAGWASATRRSVA